MRKCAVGLVFLLVASACGGGSDSAELEALREEVAALKAQATTVALTTAATTQVPTSTVSPTIVAPTTTTVAPTTAAPTTTMAPTTTITSPTTSVAVQCGDDGSIVDTYPVDLDGYLNDLVFDGTHIWVTNGLNDTVSKLRASDGELIGTYPVRDNAGYLVFDGTHIWVSGTDRVSKLRASDGELISTYPFAGYLLFDGTHIWVSGGDTVSKLRASDGELIGTYPVGHDPAGQRMGDRVIWMGFDGTHVLSQALGLERNSVWKLRASDGMLVDTYPGEGYPQFFDGTHIWSSDVSDDTVSRLRASDGVLVDTYTVHRPSSVVSDGTHFWVTVIGYEDNEMYKIRVSDGVVVGTYTVGNSGISHAREFDGTHIWVINKNDGTVSKIHASNFPCEAAVTSTTTAPQASTTITLAPPTTTAPVVSRGTASVALDCIDGWSSLRHYGQSFGSFKESRLTDLVDVCRSAIKEIELDLIGEPDDASPARVLENLLHQILRAANAPAIFLSFTCPGDPCILQQESLEGRESQQDGFLDLDWSLINRDLDAPPEVFLLWDPQDPSSGPAPSLGDIPGLEISDD